MLHLSILLTALLGLPALSASICKEIEQISAGLQWLKREHSWFDARGIDHPQIPGAIRDRIASLPEGSTIWNLGAGQGGLEQDLLETQKRDLNFLSFGLKPLKFKNKNITELTGQFFYEVPANILKESERPDAALDIHGIISYTTHLAEDLTRVARAMDPGTALMMVATETRTVVVTKERGPYSLPQYLHYTLGWFGTKDHTIFTRTHVEAVMPDLELVMYIPNQPSFRIFREPGVKIDPLDLQPFTYSIAQTLEDIRLNLMNLEHDLTIRLALKEAHNQLQQIWNAGKKISPKFKPPYWWKSLDSAIRGGLKSNALLRGLDKSANEDDVDSVDKRTLNRERFYPEDLNYEAKHTLALLRLAGFP